MIKDILLTPEIIDAIVKMLGLGLSGFGFLLMFLAYNLIRRIIDSKNTQLLTIRRSVYSFMALCLLMTLVVATFTFFNARYKLDELLRQEALIEAREAALQLSEAARLNQVLADSLLRAASSPPPHDPALLQHAGFAQKRLLDTLTILIARDKDSTLNIRYRSHKSRLIALNDSLASLPASTHLTPTLADKYRHLNLSLQAIVDTALSNMQALHTTAIPDTSHPRASSP